MRIHLGMLIFTFFHLWECVQISWQSLMFLSLSCLNLCDNISKITKKLKGKKCMIEFFWLELFNKYMLSLGKFRCCVFLVAQEVEMSKRCERVMVGGRWTWTLIVKTNISIWQRFLNLLRWCKEEYLLVRYMMHLMSIVVLFLNIHTTTSYANVCFMFILLIQL
jgi:hypothetical protein